MRDARALTMKANSSATMAAYAAVGRPHVVRFAMRHLPGRAADSPGYRRPETGASILCGSSPLQRSFLPAKEMPQRALDPRRPEPVAALEQLTGKDAGACQKELVGHLAEG